MPGHDSAQRPAQSPSIQISPQTAAEGNVIGLADSLHLRQKPQPLLRKRQRHPLPALRTRNRRQITDVRALL